MYLNITELKEDLEDKINLCGHSKDEINDLKAACRSSISEIEQVMEKVSDGTRVSPRSVDKFDPAQIREIVCDMFEELKNSKELVTSFLGALDCTLYLLTSLPIKTLKPLLKQSEYSVTIDERFAKIEQFIANEQTSKVQLENLETICNELKDHVSTLEDLKSDLSSQPPPPPPPAPTIIDWSNIKFPPLPKVTKHDQDTAFIRKEVRLSQEIQLRKNNVILRGLPVSVQTNDPLSSAKSFLAKCGIEHYKLCQKYLVSAFYLNRSDGHCTIRMVFSDQWTADHVLELAYQLKSGTELYRGVYLDKDRTDDEMKAHRTLVAELRKMREDHPTIRWVIRNGTIMNRGPISKPM